MTQRPCREPGSRTRQEYVLTDRLRLLVREGVLTRDDSGAGNVEYVHRQECGAVAVVRSLIDWGTSSTHRAG